MLWLSAVTTSFASSFIVTLGDTQVIIQRQFYGQGKIFVHLHQNETTALQAARLVAAQQGGCVLTLIHPGQRNIVFHLAHQRYEFDPNRIFTDKGIKKTLQTFGAYDKGAHMKVKKLAQAIEAALPRHGKIIAVHNNRSYSLRDYLPGHELASDAARVHVEKEAYFRNFYLVTTLRDYTRLSSLHFNSVLQANEVSDDGSLSVFLAEKRDYVNVEAGYGQLAMQAHMLRHV